MDRLESMIVFNAVVEAGSFSAAGRKLAMPLATVSRKVSELESHLGARLLRRSTRQLGLTDAGRDYVLACKRILEQIADAERIAAGEFSAPRGELVVTAPIVFGRLHVLPLICEFLKAYPEVKVQLALGDRVVNLLEDHVDIAVRVGRLRDSSLKATNVGMIQRIVCASANYCADHGTPHHPSELDKHSCVSFNALSPTDLWNFQIDGVETAIPVHSRLIVNTAEAAVDAAIAGVGITRVLSYQIANAQRAGLLIPLLQRFAPEPMPISLVYASQGRLPLKLRAFIDFAAPRLRESALGVRPDLSPENDI